MLQVITSSLVENKSRKDCIYRIQSIWLAQSNKLNVQKKTLSDLVRFFEKINKFTFFFFVENHIRFVMIF